MAAEGKTVGFWNSLKLFQKMATFVLVFFMGLLVLVTVVAQMRRSGRTGLDAGKIQQLRATDSLKSTQP